MTDAAALAEELLETLGRLRRQARRTAPRPRNLSRLSGAQLELIRRIHRQPGISVAEAADDLGLAANTISTLVGQLVRDRQVCRTTDPADRRIARLALTPQAAVQVTQWRDRRTTAVATVLASMTDGERDALVAALPVLDRVGDLLPGPDGPDPGAGR